MRFGPRKPSFKKRLAARTSWKRYARRSLGLKAPKGMGWVTTPKKTAYNRVYSRTTIDLFKLGRGTQRRNYPNTPPTLKVPIIVVGMIFFVVLSWMSR